MNDFDQILSNEFKEYSGQKYTELYQESRFYEIYSNRITENLEENTKADSVFFLWLYNLQEFHFEYSTFALNHLKDEDGFKQHLSLSNEYAYQILHFAAQSCGCFESKNPFIIMNKATFMMSNLLLTNETEKFNTIGKHLISSLNGEGCIIKKGYAKATISWFILKLYSLYSNEEIKLHELLQPKDTFPYDEVLKNWDTTDINQVNKFIELLCDAHLSQAKIDYEIYEQEEDEGDVHHLKYKELFSISTYLYPFEILTWMKLRTLKGLENPAEFSHPLMNTPIAKMFLKIKFAIVTIYQFDLV